MITSGTVAAAIKKFMATDYFRNQIAPATRISWARYLIMADLRLRACLRFFGATDATAVSGAWLSM